jgi:tripartite-type tricarboxylate transporter receptor subunit TctC
MRNWLPGALAAALVSSAAMGAERRTDFPQRPVRLIVPYAPGGATDLTARQLATKLNEVWGQGVVVDNRAGASGNIALETAARSSPDGYTLFVGNVSTNAINETTFAHMLTIKPSRDLAGVTNLIELPHVFLASTAVPASSLKELVEYVKRSGTRLNYGSAGVGSYPHLDVVRFLRAAGVDMTHVPYKGGAGQMVPAMLGNEVQFFVINFASSLPHIRAGRMKPLATTWPTRRPELPEVPTMAESGYPGIGTNAWNGLFAPAKIPAPLLGQIHATVVKVMESPEMKESLAKQYMSVVVNKSPADFQRFVEEEVRKWGKVVIDNNIKVE